MPTATATPPTKRKVRRAKPRRPLHLEPALEALNEQHRPAFVPETALCLAAWVAIPSDNTQRDQHFMVKRSWQVPVIEHLSACMEAQIHPGVLEHPRVHILLLVPRVGDEKNRGSRAKFIIDRLQVRREVEFRKPTPRGEKQKYGVRVYGLLGLIQDDALLTDETCTIDEQRATVTAEVNESKVLIWVWDDPPPPF